MRRVATDRNRRARGPSTRRASRETLDAAWQRWQASRVNSTSPLTHKTDASAFRALPAPLRARRVSEISASDFEALYDTLLASLARSSVVRYRNTYSAFFSWCQREQLIDRNPASAVRVPAGRASRPETQVWPFTPEELWAVHAALVAEAGERRASIALVMGLSSQRNPDHYPLGGEIVYYIMLCIMVAGVGVLTVRLTAMRDRLRRQKVELEAALAHIHRLATHDDLTGLVNRRHMQELLENERMRLERSEQDWCVALIDLDHFKSVNDAHGHAIGDEVLRALSRHAHTLIRRTDVLARWGGEEFVLLLPNTPIGMATISLERLREHFHAHPLVVQGIELPVSFSAGLTEHLRGETVAQTLERADKLCYQAKTLGRNRVERG